MTSPALGIYEAVSAAGNTDQFSLVADGSTFVGAITTSITGTLQVMLEMQDVDGNWQPIATLPAQSSSGAQSAVVQPLSVAPNAINVARLRWTCSGGDATFAGIVIGL